MTGTRPGPGPAAEHGAGARILVFVGEDPARARLVLTAPEGEREFRCCAGAGGAAADKREGDGCTPIGRWPLRRVFHRADRGPAPETALETVAIAPDMGWCDDPRDPARYNRPVALPYGGSHEKMRREDRLYDIVVELGYNDSPPVPGRGSAIFLHVARPDYAPTAGCVALAAADLRAVLARVGPGAVLEVTRFYP